MTPYSIAAVSDPLSGLDSQPAFTLLDLVIQLSATGASDREVVAAVDDLLETGRVRLIGQICEQRPLSN